MFGKGIVLFLVWVFVFSLAGCASMSKKDDFETQGLRNQITVLETQLQTKEDEINALKESLARNEQERQLVVAVKETSKKSVTGEVKSRPNAKQIQTALKNAGFYSGKIDGKIGKNTHEAIKDFQKANNLSVDGKVGKATWSALRECLDKKIK